MELFLLRGTSFVESVADGFVQDCRPQTRMKVKEIGRVLQVSLSFQILIKIDESFALFVQ